MIEQGNCFTFADDGYTYTYNGEIYCKCKTPKGADHIVGVVPSEPLLALLRQHPNAFLQVSCTEDKLLIDGESKSKKRTVSIKRSAAIILEANLLLPFDTLGKPSKWIELPEGWVAGVRNVAKCVSKDESKEELLGVHINPQFTEACDNYQIARLRIPLEGLASPVFVRGTHLELALPFDPARLGISKSWVHFASDTVSEIEVAVRRRGGKYKDFSNALKIKGPEASFPPSTETAVQLASVFATDSPDGDTSELVNVEIRQGEMRVSGAGVAGEFTQTMPTKYQGPDRGFKIDPKLLIELITQYHTCTIGDHRLMVGNAKSKFQYITCTREL